MKILFYGTPDFSVPTLKAILENKDWQVVGVVTQPDRPSGRGNKMTPSPIKIVAEEHNLKLFQPTSIKKDPNFLDSLSALGEIDVGVVIAFGQILPVQVLDFPKAGSVNVHASLLPRWRGAAPIQRAIMSGDNETGVCLMHMEAGLDTGPVYSREIVPITKKTTGGSLHDELSNVGARMINRDLEKIVTGTISAVTQSSEGVTHANKISAQDTLIDWSKTAKEIELIVRALAPRPGAYTVLKEKRVKIFEAEADLPRSGSSNFPGQISYVDKNNLEISCREGVLKIRTLQPEGKRLMKVDEYLRGAGFTNL